MMGYSRYYSYNNNMMGPGAFLGGLLLMLVVLIVLVGFVLLLIWAIRASNGHRMAGGMPMHPGEAGHHDAVAIAKKRLASGEITKEQYEEIMRTLHS
jgi:uncharacterized membrane protein